jgi:hypothetical protein
VVNDGIDGANKRESEIKKSVSNSKENSISPGDESGAISNAEKIRSLWTPHSSILPVSILIGDIYKEEFVVERRVGGSPSDETYEGHFVSDPSRRQILKVFCGIDQQMVMEKFKNELLVLKRLGRLLKSDYRNSIFVEEKIKGVFFNDSLVTAMHEKNFKRYSMLIKKYQGFPLVLKEKYGIDASIHPFNVIVDHSDNFHLFDSAGATLIQDGTKTVDKDQMDLLRPV